MTPGTLIIVVGILWVVVQVCRRLPHRGPISPNHRSGPGKILVARWVALGVLVLVSRASAGPPPVVVLKLDDLRDTVKARGDFSRVFDVLQERKVSAGFGIIADSCEDDGRKQPYYDLIKKWADSGRVEIWHHGYDHVKGEFSDGNYARQLDHLQRANRLLADKCGIKLVSFGAPFNATDTATVRALNAVPQLVVWMFPGVATGSKQRWLTTRCNMESKTGVVNYDLFVKQYTAHADAAYIVVQGHPPYWDEASHAAFVRIVDFCLKQGCRFSMPGNTMPAGAVPLR